MENNHDVCIAKIEMYFSQNTEGLALLARALLIVKRERAAGR